MTLVLSMIFLALVTVKGSKGNVDPNYELSNYYNEGEGFCSSLTEMKAWNKCYKPFELPKPSNDSPSTLPAGHNFILASEFNEEGEAFGVHISGLRLPAHWYHGVFQFSIPKDFVTHANKNISSLPSAFQFRSIRYNQKAVKLVDLILFNKLSFYGTIAEANGPLFNEILSTEIQIKKILDFRRYDASRDTPAMESYLLFGKPEQMFVSHIPSTCGDYQELLEVDMLEFPGRDELLQVGIIIHIQKMKMEELFNTGSRIGKDIGVKIKLGEEIYERRIWIKKVIFHDACVVNKLCKIYKNTYKCEN